MAGTYPPLTTYRPTRYDELEPDYPGSTTDYPDGGRDSRLHSTTPTRRWAIFYGNVPASEVAQWRTLAANNFYSSRTGSLDGFEFTPRGESLIAGVKYDEGGLEIREAGNTNKIYNVTVKLIKHP